MNAQPFQILIVDDNAGDIRLVQEALRETKVNNDLSICHDGMEAMAFLRKQVGYENVPSPDLILLDLNMPRKNGLEVLQEIKTDNDLKHIPVVILTTSSADSDVVKSYKLRANCYISKPVDFNQFMQVIQSIVGFWLTVVKLP